MFRPFLPCLAAAVSLWVLPAQAVGGFRIGADPGIVAASAGSTRTPVKGDGFVGAFGGGRWVPNDDFSAALGRNAALVVGPRDPVTPAGLASFGYLFEDPWAAVVDFSLSMDAFPGEHPGTGAKRTVSVSTFSLALGVQRLFDVGVPWWQPYLGGGLGIWLSTFQGIDPAKPSAPTEANASAGFLAAGSRFALGNGIGLSLELRACISEADVPGTGIAQVGGVTAAIGMYYAWRQ